MNTHVARAPLAPPSIARSAVDALYAKVSWRIIPLLLICYVVAYLDRINVGYAQLQMKQVLPFGDAVYGLGAGIFFIGYFLFEVPSNLMLEKIGARKTLLRIMFCWGIVAAAMMFVQTPTQFYILRALVYFLLLGATYAMVFWVPTLIKSWGVADMMQIGLYSALPSLIGVFGMILIGRHSDKHGERRWHFERGRPPGALQEQSAGLDGRGRRREPGDGDRSRSRPAADRGGTRARLGRHHGQALHGRAAAADDRGSGPGRLRAVRLERAAGACGHTAGDR